MRHSTPALLLLFVMLFSLTLPGCKRSAVPPKGPTENEVRNRYRERFAELGRHLAAIAGKVPTVGTVKKVSAPALDPPPVFFINDEFAKQERLYKYSGNTGLLSVEELSNLEAKPALSLGPPTDVNYPRVNFRRLKETYNGPDEDGRLARDFEAGLALRYLIVYRITKLVRPGLTFGEKMGFTPGSVDMEVFLIDLKTDQVAASCPVLAKTPKQVRIFNSTEKDRDTESPVVRILERIALSEMYKNLATTRGKFEHRPLL